MRGTHEHDQLGWRIRRIIPAHAGNTMTLQTMERMHGDHPRACGEHRAKCITEIIDRGSSPRMRGTPVHCRALKRHSGIIPAHAGNTQQASSSRPRAGDHPRACGEHCDAVISAYMLSGSSPRMRGTPLEPHFIQNSRGIIPAHAGNTEESYRKGMVWWDHPRACGEHRLEFFGKIEPEGSSPRMRGTRVPYPTSFAMAGIIPAHAGNTDNSSLRVFLFRDHPRACGGTLSQMRCEDRQLGIIPAHAGNTGRRTDMLRSAWDHPRACGEHSTAYWPIADLRGSSPRMRGTQHGEKRQMAKLGIIPAHAGNTDRHSCRSTAKRDHPRACGEHDSADITGMFQTGSSPRMRGTPPGRGCNIVSKGIIPAHAGNTSTPCARPRPRRDHPRACGEHIL